ncbi:MAG TPA: SDR family oxidoreductase [Abditibacteriaceae bacterium]|jgi:NAD(P)-dependent dehydrogenase (short-subunit alcohol dehydrogenase family)
MTEFSFDLTGRVALLTGAGRGIGLGMARGLAAYGCAIAIQDIELDVAQEAAVQIENEGGRALALGGDAGDLKLLEEWVETVQQKLGGLHCLINNAAIQHEISWMEETIDEFEHQWRVNLLAPVRLSQLCVPIFREQKWGRIINIGSIQGKSGNPTMLPYSMSKAALENMTKGLARELGEHGITVNMMSPGYFNTWRNRDQFQTPEDFVKRGQWVPMKRVGQPEDCAGAALLLCSEAGGYITGQNLYVDGGISAR